MRTFRGGARLLAAACAVITVLSPAAVATAAQPSAGPRGTEPVYDYSQAIRERVWVQVPVDSDADGRPDRVAVRIIRPRETGDTRKIPVIFQPSPYYAGLNDVPNHDDIDRDGAAARRSAAAGRDRAAETIVFSGYLDNYFVPRGYAVAYADSLGTGGSTGCPTSGGRNETLGMKAVIDWLNGRAPGFDESGAPALASWSTGRTGMIGVSYNGTLPNAVAATGVRGLETIVPIAAISRWYDYYRANGGVVAPGGFQGEDTDVLAKAVLTRENPETCAGVMAGLEREQDRETGDHSRFWAERDYLRDAAKVRASVLLVHGLHDDNVRTQQAGQWWDALARRGVPRKIWWHQAGHTDPFHVRRDAWLATLHRWFDQWLYRIDTGIMREPMADVEVAPGQWRTATTWPVSGTASSALALGGPAADGRVGTLQPWPAPAGARQTFVDEPSRTAEDLVAQELGADPNRLSYLSAPLEKEARLSGTPEITIRADLAGKSPYLTALLVDYGTADRFAGIRTVPGQQDCIGPGIPEDPGCFNRREYVTEQTPFEIVSRGWLDVRNRLSPSHSRPIEAGKAYTFRWNLQTQDHVFASGHRIGLVLISTDRDHTLRYPAGTEVGVRLGVSKVLLPLAG
ncbi:Xaa-Pro dipeptidyl-peptidase [Couchioplanes caeruleus]|uniref:Xaa-Pro dipeptidyl-peptidase n=2 Tax=Couchioplanes caeruleus TaxID=56438 RepID=A0A1K0GX79_9ACTN|nr:Xaa-Pro dipeptidyl-peptidase [Couchioplanes caeruleus]OJF16020.1 Xaa-Pro dipeptidase [Couchioplanes caeruleus subsp. caeruleus]ROP27877.1 X-Pro dipeptidyl-peptidase [Couchioplanes caeruleus]